MTDTKDITLIDVLDNSHLDKIVLTLKKDKPILRYQYNEDLTLEFNFLDVWTIFFAAADAMAQCEYKELLNTSGYIPVHQILCIADCYKCIDKSLLNNLIYLCYILNYEGKRIAYYKYVM